jgi:hypothetical protein
MVGIILSGGVVFADEAKCQKYYMQNLKGKFGINGTKFASLHTQDELADLFADDAKGFIKEFGEKYQNAKPILESPEMKDKFTHIIWL